jgi:hypothetical protein
MARLIAAVSSACPSPTAPKRRTSKSGEAAAGPTGELSGGMLTWDAARDQKLIVALKRTFVPGWVVRPVPEMRPPATLM